MVGDVYVDAIGDRVADYSLLNMQDQVEGTFRVRTDLAASSRAYSASDKTHVKLISITHFDVPVHDDTGTGRVLIRAFLELCSAAVDHNTDSRPWLTTRRRQTK